MYKEDIRGSIAHNVMLEKQNIINKNDSKKIEEELKKIQEEIESGKLKIDEKAEDIHMFVETELINRIGNAVKS